MYKVSELKFYISYFNLKFSIVKMKTTIGGQYDSNLVIENLNITLYVIPLCCIKIPNCNSYNQMKYMVQSRYISQKQKTKTC